MKEFSSRFKKTKASKNNRLLKEFYYLRERFDIKTKIVVGHNQVFKNRKGLNNASATYNPRFDYIALPDLRYSHTKLLVLLHEIGHAIQNKEKRLHYGTNRKTHMYGDEIDAELFAHYYGEKIYGIRSIFWIMADYEDYCYDSGLIDHLPKETTPPGIFFRRNQHRLNDKVVKNVKRRLKELNKRRTSPIESCSCERGNKIILI